MTLVPCRHFSLTALLDSTCRSSKATSPPRLPLSSARRVLRTSSKAATATNPTRTPLNSTRQVIQATSKATATATNPPRLSLDVARRRVPHMAATTDPPTRDTIATTAVRLTSNARVGPHSAGPPRSFYTRKTSEARLVTAMIHHHYITRFGSILASRLWFY